LDTHGKRARWPNLRTAMAASAALLALAAAGCGSSHEAAGSSGSARASTVTIDLTPQGCTPRPAKIAAGQVTFDVTNKNAGGVSEAEPRVYYERIEPVAEIWGSLDTAIDGRWENPVTVASRFIGFHKLEQLMWEDNTLAGAPRLCTARTRRASPPRWLRPVRMPNKSRNGG